MRDDPENKNKWSEYGCSLPHSLAYLAQHLYRGDQNLELVGTGGVGVHLETDVLFVVNVTAL